ncbi:MAG: RHS repeat-associated core domain-containing protein [Pontiellaceae bacterium]|jgi:RHS repeat-associated protein|nr:RHS repeat-associated core domain-containing protein [Pontiellaceae bacterium]
MGGGVGGMVYSIKWTGSTPETRNSELLFSHANHRGDVIARSDENGSLTSFALYEAYGTRPYEWGSDPDRQKANTKEEEKGLGLANDGRRYRDLVTGTYTTRDPIGYGDGPNIYCYVHCNPITRFDAFGLMVDLTSEQEVTILRNQRQSIVDAKCAEAHVPPGKEGVFSPGFVCKHMIDCLGGIQINGGASPLIVISRKANDQIKTEEHEKTHLKDYVSVHNEVATALNKIDGRIIRITESKEKNDAAVKQVEDYITAEKKHIEKYVGERGEYVKALDNYNANPCPDTKKVYDAEIVRIDAARAADRTALDVQRTEVEKLLKPKSESEPEKSKGN